jgi:GNAT superfamily N-acetyltransferase
MTDERPQGRPDRVVASVRRVASRGPEARRGEAATRAGSLAIRPATPSDMAACARVWEASVADYERALNMPVLPLDLGPTERLVGHIRETDPDRFWVAERVARDAGSAAADERVRGGGDQLVAFGSANVRGDVWFLSMLFVLPEEQASGLGRALLERTFPGGRLPAPGEPWTGDAGLPSILGTATDAAQPVSNALYARYGVVPRLPVWRLTGRPGPSHRFPDLPAGVRPVAFQEMAAGPPGGPGHRQVVEAVGGVDRAVLGYDHPADHRYLRREGRDGYLYRGPDGVPVGYGYASAVGRIGPIATVDPALLPAIAGHLLRAVEPRGASTMWVPGAADGLFRALLEAGFRLDGFPALLCWSRPFASFDRYVPISLALL